MLQDSDGGQPQLKPSLGGWMCSHRKNACYVCGGSTVCVALCKPTFTDKLSVEVTFYFYLQTSAQVMLNLCQCYRVPLLKFNLLHREQCYKMTVFEYMYVR